MSPRGIPEADRRHTAALPASTRTHPRRHPGSGAPTTQVPDRMGSRHLSCPRTRPGQRTPRTAPRDRRRHRHPRRGSTCVGSSPRQRRHHSHCQCPHRRTTPERQARCRRCRRRSRHRSARSHRASGTPALAPLRRTRRRHCRRRRCQAPTRRRHPRRSRCLCQAWRRSRPIQARSPLSHHRNRRPAPTVPEAGPSRTATRLHRHTRRHRHR